MVRLLDLSSTCNHSRKAGEYFSVTVEDQTYQTKRCAELGTVLLFFCLAFSQIAIAEDFTEDYWPASPSGSVCKTSFVPLPPPEFVTDKDTSGRSVVRSNRFRETEAGRRTFSGNVKVKRDDLLLTSGHLDWLTDGELNFEHGLSLFHELGAMSIEQADFSLDTQPQTATLQNLEFVLFPIPLQGSLANLKADDKLVEASKFKFSTCDPKSERWGLHVNRIRINRETSRITVRGVKFQVGKLPVLYVPYFTFRPQNEKDGFDTIRLRYRSDNGFILEQPIKFIGSDARFKLMPRYLSKNGFQLGTSLNWHGFATSLDWTPKDRKLDKSSPSTIDPARWRVQANHHQEWGAWLLDVDFTQTSDFAYQHDFEFDSLTQPQFATNNIASLHYTARDHRLRLTTQRFNSTSADEVLGKAYPEFDFEWNPSWQWLSFGTRVNAASYRRGKFQSQRRLFEQSLEGRISPAWGRFQFGGSTSRTHYELDDDAISSRYDRTITSAHLSGSVYFDKEHANSLYTVQPRLLYSKRSYTDPIYKTPFDAPRETLQTAQIFDSTRTASLDRIPGEHRLSTGLSVQIQPFNQSQTEFNTDIAYVRHFDGIAGESDAESAWAMAISMYNKSGFQLEHRQYRSHVQAQANEHATMFIYQPRAGTSVYASLGRRLRDGIDQSEFGFRLPLSSRWETIAAINYDWQREDVAETHAGLQFNGCCYQATFVVQRALDWDFIDGAYSVELEDRFMIRFGLTGLGSLGRNRIESLLERKNFGFHNSL